MFTNLLLIILFKQKSHDVWKFPPKKTFTREMERERLCYTLHARKEISIKSKCSFKQESVSTWRTTQVCHSSITSVLWQRHPLSVPYDAVINHQTQTPLWSLNIDFNYQDGRLFTRRLLWVVKRWWSSCWRLELMLMLEALMEWHLYMMLFSVDTIRWWTNF